MTNTATVPTPATVFGGTRRKPQPLPDFVQPEVTAIEVDLTQPAKLRPGYRYDLLPHDGIFKTKQLKRGMRVRNMVKGEPRGSEKVVDHVERLGNGSQYKVVFASAHNDETRPAAYRWFSQDVADNGLVRQVPALTPYEEV